MAKKTSRRRKGKWRNGQDVRQGEGASASQIQATNDLLVKIHTQRDEGQGEQEVKATADPEPLEIKEQAEVFDSEYVFREREIIVFEQEPNDRGLPKCH